MTAIIGYRFGYLPQGATLNSLDINSLPLRPIQSLSEYHGNELMTGQFVDGETYYPVLKVYDNLNNYTEYVSPTGFTVDSSGLVISNVNLTGLVSNGINQYLTDITLVDFTANYTDYQTQAAVQFGIQARLLENLLNGLIPLLI
ncbi:MAG: hypothetical protein KAX49_11040 [Halanaerobiales bacterium]|nr:hypothetical protein [Halanaerobiales bacterium]